MSNSTDGQTAAVSSAVQPPREIPFPPEFENSADPDMIALKGIFRRMLSREDYTAGDVQAYDMASSVSGLVRAHMQKMSVDRAQEAAKRLADLEKLNVQLQSLLSDKNKIIQDKTATETRLRGERDSARMEATEKGKKVNQLEDANTKLQGELAAAQSINEDVVKSQHEYWEGMRKRLKTENNIGG